MRKMRELTIIEDLEYIGSGLFGTCLGPLSFDFGDFGIEENGYLLVPYLTPEQYLDFKIYIVERRRNYNVPGDRGFRFETVFAHETGIEIIKGIAQEIQDICGHLPNDGPSLLNEKARQISRKDDTEFSKYQSALKKAIGRYVLLGESPYKEHFNQ